MRAYGQVQEMLHAGCDVRVITSSEQGFDKNDNFQHFREHSIFYKGKKTFSKISNAHNKKSFLQNYLSLAKSFLIRSLPKSALRTFILISNIVNRYEEFPGWSRTIISEYSDDLEGWKPEVIFSSYSPIDSHIAASRISKELNVPWVAEYRDCWSFNTMGFSENQNDLLSRLLRKKEKNILQECKLILAATPFIKSYYEDFYNKNVELLLGGWEEEGDYNDLQLQKANDKIEILHLGSMLHGTRSLSPILSLLENFPDLGKKYSFSFVGRDTELFQNKVNNSNSKMSFTLTNQVSFKKAEQLGFAADILLILMKESEMERYTLTGKLFEYIKFQKPIICFDPYQSEVSNFIESFDMGYVVRSIDELASLLQSKLSPNDFLRISDENREKFSRSHQISGLLENLSFVIRDFDNY